MDVGRTLVGDHHLVVRLLSPEEGKFAVMARGARRSKKRYAGCFELGTDLEIQTSTGRGSLPVVKEVNVLRAPKRARQNLLCLAYLTYGCEICFGLAAECQEAQKLTGLLRAWLALLESEEGPSRASRWAFEAKALTFGGLTPHFLKCARCGAEPEGAMRFSPLHGGALHAHCAEGVPVTLKDLSILERVRRTPLMETRGLTAKISAPNLLVDFLQHHIGRALKSYSWVQEVEEIHNDGD